MDPIYLSLRQAKADTVTVQTSPIPEDTGNSTKLHENKTKKNLQTPAIPQTKPTIIPKTYTKTTPPESFPSPKYGNVTWHTLISAPTTKTTDLSAGIAVCPPGTGHLCAHRHEQAELYHILEGEGEVTIDGVVSPVRAGDTVFVPSNAEHGVVNTATAGTGTGGGDLRWFYVFPTGSFGNVVYRFSKDQLDEGVEVVSEGAKAKL